LRTLAAAGLLTTRREGYYVVYSLVPDKLTTLSNELAYLIGRSAEDVGRRRGSAAPP
jgi:DNA-binding transcriptional ArsR family regulator